MVIIGFFQNLFNSFGDLFNFVVSPLGQLNSDITVEPFKSMSIMSLLGASIGTVLVILVAIHLVRLFVGG